MTTCLTFRDVPAGLRDELKRRAKANKRSLNKEGVTLLTEVLSSGGRMDEKELLRRINSFPRKHGLSVAETRAAIREGRK